RKKMLEARAASPTVSSDNDMRNLEEYKQKKAQLKALENSLQKLKRIYGEILKVNEMDDIETYIKDHADSGIAGNDYGASNIQRILNNCLKKAKEIILKEFPLEFSEEIAAVFNKLEKKDIERFQLLHVEHVVNLKRAEIDAMMHPEDVKLQKAMHKALVLYQIETSQLQYEISQAIVKNTKEYQNKIIESALVPILQEFTRGETFGAYEFKFPESVAEEMQQLLRANLDLLQERERNEIALAYYREQFSAYSELADNFKKYGVLTQLEGNEYERLKSFYESEMKKALNIQQQCNGKHAIIIGKFIVANSVNENDKVVNGIKEALGSAANQDMNYILTQAEKGTELGWLQWLSTQTFADRCKRGMAGLVAAGGAGGLGGAAAGMGIFSPVTGTAGMIGGGVLGGILGFMSPEVGNQAQAKIGELKQMAVSFIWGETNKISAEYFKDPIEMTGLNPKYEPTERMYAKWGEKGAEIIASAYVNLLFDLHVKLLYSDSENKIELQQLYLHFYRNYQMLRGDSKEIINLYKGESWGADRAEKQINIANTLDLEAHLKQDLAAMMLLAEYEDKIQTNKMRNAISTLANGMKTLSQEPQLLSQFQESPEFKQLPPALSQKMFENNLLIEAQKKALTNDPEKGSEKEPIVIMGEQDDEHEIEEEAKLEIAPVKQSQMIVKKTVTPSSTKAIVPIDKKVLKQQELVMVLKEQTLIVAQHEAEKQKIKTKFNQVDALAKIARGNKHTAHYIAKAQEGFIEKNTTLNANMNVAKAADCLKAQEYEKFQFWFENIFLPKYKSKNNVTQKDALSRKMLDDDGLLQYQGKSIWHLLAEDSINGNEIFLFMMRKIKQTGFEPFVNCFDFDYVDEYGLNGIVYAAKLSNPDNNELLDNIFIEAIGSYPAEEVVRQKLNKTFEDIIQLKQPGNILFKPVCRNFVYEIEKLFKAKVAEKISQTSFASRMYYSTVGSSQNFEKDKWLSAILATMAIYCTQGNPIPKTESEFMGFLTHLSKSEYLDESMKELIHDVEMRDRICQAEVQYLDQETALFQFAEEHKNDKIKAIAQSISTSEPRPTKEEQELLIDILKEGSPSNVEAFKQVAINKLALIKRLIAENRKFDGKNLIWLAVEAGREDIALMLYQLSTKAFMNEAGPNGSVFTFAAKQENKSSFGVISHEVAITKFGGAGLSRFVPDEQKKIAAHHIFQTGTWNDIQNYLLTETRYKSPDFKRLTGGPDSDLKQEPKFYLDNNGSMPLHELLKREDAEFILNKLVDFVAEKNLTILDLFDVAGLNIPNQDGVTPLEWICEALALREAFFGAMCVAKTVNAKYADPAY
ncbi:MAG TPA: hypothetical protein PLD88_08565, partial [Candidatus Berkiella sp.]|nr:hypothetical protein [Candidatus Berkiella sp.]